MLEVKNKFYIKINKLCNAKNLISGKNQDKMAVNALKLTILIMFMLA